nr:hypothetical protein [Microvirga roseola]
MRQSLLGYLEARSSLRNTARRAGLALALVMIGSGAQAQTVAALPAASQPVAQIGAAKPIVA